MNEIIGILFYPLIGCLFYLWWVNDTKKTNREWREEFNKDYTKKVYVGVHLYVLIFLCLLGAFFLYSELASSEERICIEEIEKWQESNFFDTTYSAFINEKYEIALTRPNEFNKGDCISLKIYEWWFSPEVIRK